MGTACWYVPDMLIEKLNNNAPLIFGLGLVYMLATIVAMIFMKEKPNQLEKLPISKGIMYLLLFLIPFSGVWVGARSLVGILHYGLDVQLEQLVLCASLKTAYMPTTMIPISNQDMVITILAYIPTFGTLFQLCAFATLFVWQQHKKALENTHLDMVLTALLINACLSWLPLKIPNPWLTGFIFPGHRFWGLYKRSGEISHLIVYFLVATILFSITAGYFGKRLQEKS
jgi:uncharacterized membrane protein YpjA